MSLRQPVALCVFLIDALKKQIRSCCLFYYSLIKSTTGLVGWVGLWHHHHQANLDRGMSLIKANYERSRSLSSEKKVVRVVRVVVRDRGCCARAAIGRGVSLLLAARVCRRRLVRAQNQVARCCARCFIFYIPIPSLPFPSLR